MSRRRDWDWRGDGNKIGIRSGKHDRVLHTPDPIERIDNTPSIHGLTERQIIAGVHVRAKVRSTAYHGDRRPDDYNPWWDGNY
jgi:hypothetical protein